MQHGDQQIPDLIHLLPWKILSILAHPHWNHLPTQSPQNSLRVFIQFGLNKCSIFNPYYLDLPCLEIPEFVVKVVLTISNEIKLFKLGIKLILIYNWQHICNTSKYPQIIKWQLLSIPLLLEYFETQWDWGSYVDHVGSYGGCLCPELLWPDKPEFAYFLLSHRWFDSFFLPLFFCGVMESLLQVFLPLDPMLPTKRFKFRVIILPFIVKPNTLHILLHFCERFAFGYTRSIFCV